MGARKEIELPLDGGQIEYGFLIVAVGAERGLPLFENCEREIGDRRGGMAVRHGGAAWRCRPACAAIKLIASKSTGRQSPQHPMRETRRNARASGAMTSREQSQPIGAPCHATSRRTAPRGINIGRIVINVNDADDYYSNRSELSVCSRINFVLSLARRKVDRPAIPRSRQLPKITVHNCTPRPIEFSLLDSSRLDSPALGEVSTMWIDMQLLRNAKGGCYFYEDDEASRNGKRDRARLKGELRNPADFGWPSVCLSVPLGIRDLASRVPREIALSDTPCPSLSTRTKQVFEDQRASGSASPNSTVTNRWSEAVTDSRARSITMRSVRESGTLTLMRIKRRIAYSRRMYARCTMTGIIH